MSDMQRNLLYTYHPCMICIDISVSDMRTTCSGMHTHLLYAYRTQMICVPEQVVCISSMSDMRTINVYAYQKRTICKPPALGMHIVCVQYVYHLLWYAYRTWTICVHILFVCISSVSDMRTRAGGMHIGHGQYAYTFIVCILDTDDMHTNKCVCISSVSDMRTRAGGTHVGHG